MEDIITAVRYNTSLRYYNISTKKFINASSISKMELVDNNCKIVSDLVDKKLFNQIRRELKSDNKEFKDNKDNKDNRILKRSIPAPVRSGVWRKYIGDSMDGACYSCNKPLSYENWQAGHILAFANGGKETIENLRPLCAQCNTSMGSMHMFDFIKKHNMPGKGAYETDPRTRVSWSYWTIGILGGILGYSYFK